MSGLSVSTRLTLWNVATAGVLVALLGLGVSWKARTDLLDGADRELRQRADRFQRSGFGRMMPPMQGPASGMAPGMGPGRAQPGQPPANPAGIGQGENQPPGPGSVPRPELGGPPQPAQEAGQPLEQTRQGQGLRRGQRRGAPAQAEGATPGQMPPANGPLAGPMGPRGPGMQRQGGQPQPTDPLRPRLLNDLETAKIRGSDPAWDFAAFQDALKGKESTTTVDLQGESYRIYTRPLPQESPDRVVQLAHPLSETYRAIDGINRTLLAFTPLSLLLVALAGFFVTRKALRPVGEMAAAADSITAQNLGGRLQTKGADEFAALGQTINGMLGRLERAFRELEDAIELQRRFTADASHELRTPLAAIKANTSLALTGGERQAADYRQAIESIDAAAERMSVLVQDLLTLARADGGRIALDRESLDLRDAIETSVAAYQGKGAAISIAMPERTVPVLGSELALIRLFENLLSNAVRHAPKDGKIEVAIVETEDCVEVSVSDSGEGVDDEQMQHLGERFFRAEKSRARSEGGFGLGLAICRSIAEAHQGSLTFSRSALGGLSATVRLPR